MPPAGQADGRYDWLGYAINVAEGQARTLSGQLAGSVLTLDQAVRNAVACLGLTAAQAVRLASEATLRSIGVETGGRVARVEPADLVALDAGLCPCLTLVGGRVVWERPAPDRDRHGSPAAGTR
ncbi:MAG: hypothetical protein FJ029_05155 [Actinobacteria bacterium]|nr:hypothetical protein [Actinomycetota bacterium]